MQRQSNLVLRLEGDLAAFKASQLNGAHPLFHVLWLMQCHVLGS